jgi:CHAT domain-containing protein
MSLWKRLARLKWLLVCLTAGMAIAASVLLPQSTRPAQRLIRAASSESWRPLEGRLNGFRYTPRSSGSNDSGALGPITNQGWYRKVFPLRDPNQLGNLRSVAGSIMADPGDDPHTAAVAALLFGKSHEAVAELEALVKRNPGDAACWNDLAVARLSSAGDDAHLMAQALAAADHALALQPEQQEALFNRALALDALGIRFASIDAWHRYLSVDPGSPWAVEARTRLQHDGGQTRDQAWKRDEPVLNAAADRLDVAAVDRLVAAYPLQARSAVEAIHLPAWANAALAGDTAASGQALRRVRILAAALKRANGDGLLDEAAAKISSESAAAFSAYGHGRADNTARRLEMSLQHFEEAERGFAAAGNPMELNAAYFRANALVDLHRQAESQAIAAALEPRLEPSYRSLKAHLLWLRARFTAGAGRHYESLLAIQEARAAFENLGELDYSIRLRAGEAEMLARLGRDREAWHSRHVTLRDACASGKWSLIEPALQAIAREEVDGPDADVARSLFDVQVSAPSTLPLMRFNGLLWSAYLEGRNDGKVQDMTAARRAAALIPDARQREEAIDELRLAQGMALRTSDPAAAEPLLSEVIDYRERAGLLAYLPSVYLQRARVRERISRALEAQQDLRKTIALLESRRERIADDSLRDAFLGRSDEAYAELGDLLLARGDWIGAFEISERARGRILVDQAGRGPASAAQIAAAMKPGVLGVHYTSFPSHTLLVIFEHGSVTHQVIQVKRSELERLRDRLASDPGADAAARRLYELLVTPLGPYLLRGGLLVIAPDDITYGIPFAALRDSSGHFLIEETAIAIAPAGAAMATESQRLELGRSRLAIVADPATSTALSPQLSPLPAARRDAVSLPRMFGQTTSLVGEEATLPAFRSAVRECDVLHVAAHALSSPNDASLSLIALAPSAGDGGLLYLEAIESLQLRRRPLVVLAGCQTGSFGGGRGSMRSLAHAFLAAGSCSVLSALWDVDDVSASELTKELYRSLSRGKTVPAALREAQLSMIQAHEPRDWAAFQLHLSVDPAEGKTWQRAVFH